MKQFYGNNATPQFIHIGEITVANYTGVRISNLSGYWKAFPKLNDIIYVTGNRNGGFTPIELEALPIIDLIPEKGVIICDKQGFELPVTFRLESCLEKGFIAYFSSKEY